VVAAPQIPRRVADDRDQHAFGLRRLGAQILADEQGVERVLDDIERIRGARALAAGDRGEPAGVIARQAADPVGTTARAHGW